MSKELFGVMRSFTDEELIRYNESLSKMSEKVRMVSEEEYGEYMYLKKRVADLEKQLVRANTLHSRTADSLREARLKIQQVRGVIGNG